MKFIRVGKGHIRAVSPFHDVCDIRQNGAQWVLTVLEADTSLLMHTASARKAYLACQEACRYFQVGAFRPSP